MTRIRDDNGWSNSHSAAARIAKRRRISQTVMMTHNNDTYEKQGKMIHINPNSDNGERRRNWQVQTHSGKDSSQPRIIDGDGKQQTTVTMTSDIDETMVIITANFTVGSSQ